MYYSDDAIQRSGNLIRVYLCIFKDDFEGENIPLQVSYCDSIKINYS